MFDKYNEQRKRILHDIDKGKDISNIELGMYDLTPYFKEDKFDLSLTEAIMLNKNYARKIYHIDKNVFFSPPQYRAFICLLEQNRVMLSAPTSFGKTLLIKEYIFKTRPKNVVYIVPTNALAYELEKSFKQNLNFSDYIIYDKCSDIEMVENSKDREEYLFFIGTQEKFLEIDKGLIGEIDLFVIDEAYKLQDSIKYQRAYKLSETFLESITEKAKKIFLLTPKAKFDGFEKYDFYLYESNFNSVEKNYVVLQKDTFFEQLKEKGKEEKTILFCNSPNQINEAYNQMNINKDKKWDTDFVKMLENDVHPDWSVVKLLKSGILTHHGQMPKYVQNRMINLFNESSEYNILFGTNSISEGINTVTKNMFIHPDYDTNKNILLLKNTVGRAGRLGKYPIGHIYSTSKIDEKLDDEIIISLAISNEEELAEIEDSKNSYKILEFSQENNIEFDLCKEILKKHKFSLSKLGDILNALRKNRNYKDISNLPFIINDAFKKEYNGRLNIDKIIIKGYLQMFYYNKNKEKIQLNDFNDRINFFKEKSSKKEHMDNTDIINCYMQFIYSTLEYYIMPVVNIGLELKNKVPNWEFGNNVIESLEMCNKKYFKKTYGNLNVDNLSEAYIKIIGVMKDYGMTAMVKKLSESILEEIQSCLNVRYSTVDVLRAIERLSLTSVSNKSFYLELKRRYML